MCDAVRVPVTVKHRIGIDDQDSYQALAHFVETIAVAGCETFIVHARKAWLKGLSPKENREVPPLQYDAVYQLKKDFPQLNIVINGGLLDLQQAQQQLGQVDGVMLGRAIYQNPYLLAEVDGLFYDDDHDIPGPRDILEAYLPYVSEQLAQGVRLHAMTRHILGLFQGMPGAKAWRRHISEQAPRADADLQVLIDAANKVRDV
jgi:tRNA-dihydrouridine synthase A